MPEAPVTATTIPGLQASSPERLPFGPSLDMRAFRLRRAQGDLLVYSAREGEGEEAASSGAGPIARRYLGHRHEAMFVPDGVGAPLVCHERERESVAKTHAVEDTFSERHLLDDDFEVIPTPGHTSGASAFLWTSGGHRALFTGDTIYLDQGEWVAAVLGSSDREQYLESLERIRALDFDVLVPWITSAGQPSHVLTDPADTRRRIDAILARLRRGEDR